jgi:hypothetical protein
MSKHYEYDDDIHAYFLVEEDKKTEFPSVTQILKQFGLVDESHYNERARKRGTDVHIFTARLDDVSNVLTIPEDIKPYINQYIRFLSDVNPTWTQIESPLISEKLGYAGTFDRLGYINNKYVLVDIKTGTLPKWVGLQLTMYARLIIDIGLKFPSIYSLQLTETGYNLTDHTASLGEYMPIADAIITLNKYKGVICPE